MINGLGVDGSGWLTRITSSISGVWDSWIVDGLVNLAARIVWVFSCPVRMLQTGRVSRYALFMLLGVLDFPGLLLVELGIQAAERLRIRQFILSLRGRRGDRGLCFSREPKERSRFLASLGMTKKWLRNRDELG